MDAREKQSQKNRKSKQLRNASLLFNRILPRDSKASSRSSETSEKQVFYCFFFLSFKNMNLFTIETMQSIFFVNAVFGSMISFINSVWDFLEISRHSHYLIKSYAFPRLL